MTSADVGFFVIGSLGAIISGTILMYWGFAKSSRLWSSARIVYISIGIVEFYNSLIYALVLFKVLPMVGYGAWVRPLAFVNYLSPMLIAIIHRTNNGRKL